MNNGTSLSARPITGRWRLDRKRSRVEFRTRSLWGLVAVSGHFDVYDGWLDLAAEPAIELTIDTASLQTGNAKRDKHLRSADFFDSEQHPQMRFVAESVEPRGTGDTLHVRGRLSARGRSVPLELAAHVQAADGSLDVSATVTAPHRELGMTWNWLGAIRPTSKLRVTARLIPAS